MKKLHWSELMITGFVLIIAGGMFRAGSAQGTFDGPLDALYYIFINHAVGWTGVAILSLGLLKLLFSKVDYWT